MHKKKTGALINCAVNFGVLLNPNIRQKDSKILFNLKNNISSRLIGLFFTGIILFIFNLMVLGDTIDKWEKNGQIDEWVDEGKLKIDKRRSYRY